MALRDGIESFASYDDLSKVAVFEDTINHVIAKEKRKNKSGAKKESSSEAYASSKHSTFRLMRDGFMHGPSKRFVSS